MSHTSYITCCDVRKVAKSSHPITYITYHLSHLRAYHLPVLHHVLRTLFLPVEKNDVITAWKFATNLFCVAFAAHIQLVDFFQPYSYLVCRDVGTAALIKLETSHHYHYFCIKSKHSECGLMDEGGGPDQKTS